MKVICDSNQETKMKNGSNLLECVSEEVDVTVLRDPEW